MRCGIGFHGLMCLLMVLAAPSASAQRHREKSALPNLVLNKPNHVTPFIPRFAANRLIVRFRAGKSSSVRAAVHALAGGRAKRRFRTLPDIEVVQLESSIALGEALRRYRSQADVLYAEPDYQRTLFDRVPNDPMFPELWGLSNTGQSGGLAGADIGAVKAWDLSTGSGNVVVGTIDTGVDWNHPDLAANIYRNDSDCSDDGLDNDGNGFVDDCHGFNAVAGRGDPSDSYKHGTHVAGIIGAVGNNGSGVVGVNWEVKILACKADDGDGGIFDSAILSCLDYMATMKDRGVNIVATNNSYGGLFENKAITDAVREQMRRGILFVAAAANGRSNNDSVPVFPANTDLPNVLAVAATDHTDSLASFSGYGRHTVHLGAPGVAITSTVPGGGYATWDGTSMAAPHVVGAAALLKAYGPTLDWWAIKNRLVAGSDALDSLTAMTVYGRRLNVHRAMTCANQEVTARLNPRKDNVYVAVGEPVRFSMLHIICATPAGESSVNAGGDTVALRDDGASGDEAAGDGVYTGTWTPAAIGDYSATFSNGDVITVHVLKPYIFSTSEYQWRTIVGASLNLYDEETATVTPPFPVRFGGLSFPSIAVDANGVIRMLAANEPQPWGQWGVPYIGFPLPTDWLSNAVAPLWTDLVGFPEESNMNVFWEVIGDAPNRELVIEWRNVEHYLEYADPGGVSPVTFQVVFFENGDDVLFNYADTIFDNEWYDYGNSASIGVQVSQGVAMQFSCFAPVVRPGTAVRWQTAESTPTSIELLWPNGGEIWRPGEDRTIWWNASGPAATDFRIEVLKGDALDSILAASVPASAGGYTFTMPVGQVRGADYKVRLVSNTDAGVSHSSAGDFIIDDMHMLEVLAGYSYWAGGHVVSSPPGIDCHFICHAPFATGTVVTLTQTPDPKTAFNGWYGACTGTGPCVVTLNQDLQIFAEFIPGADTTPPVISGVAAMNITASSATIVWTTDEASDSQVEYGLSTAYGNSTTPDPTKVTSHSVVLSAWSIGTYHFRVKSRDTAGNLATSGDYSFAALAPNFALVAVSNSATVRAGATASYSLRLDPGQDATNPVALACSGLPQYAACSFDKNNISLAESSVTVNLNLTTKLSSSAEPVSLTLFISPMLVIVGVLFFSPRRPRRRAGLMLLIALAAIVYSGCGGAGGGGGGGGSTVTPVGTYTVTVIATSGQAIRTATVTLVVQ